MGIFKGMLSDNSTSAGTRRNDSKGVSWNNYQGTKTSHDVRVDQMNFKSKDNDHTFYSPKSGKQGVAGGNRDRKK